MNKRYLTLYHALGALLLIAFCGCQRPELWVSTEEFKQVELAPDWSKCNAEPGGMTAFFFRNDGAFYRHTTADIHLTTLGLPRGDYQGVVFSYSPEEYGRMTFTGLERSRTAAVKVLPLAEQPSADEDLYGINSTGEFYIPTVEGTGMHEVSCLPEDIDTDTLANMSIVTGTDGDFIPYKDRDSYRNSLVTQRFSCTPVSPLWDLRIVIYIKGINYLYNVKGTVVGLADGYRLIDAAPTSQTCMQQTGMWEVKILDDNTGYIATTMSTFGLPVADATRSDGELPLRLNLQIMLRDEETLLNYHYDIGPYVATIEANQELRVTLGTDFDNHPDLPYVDAKGSAGFGVDVTPWEEGKPVDIKM